MQIPKIHTEKNTPPNAKAILESKPIRVSLICANGHFSLGEAFVDLMFIGFFLEKKSENANIGCLL